MLVEVLPWCCWLLTNQGGGCITFKCLWQFLKIRKQWILPHGLILPFIKVFSVAWMIFNSIFPTELLTKSVNLLKPCNYCISTKFVLYSTPFVFVSTRFTTSSGEDHSISRNYFLCSSLRRNYPLKFYHEITALQSHHQAPLQILVVLLFPQVQLLPPLKSWTPPRHPWG